MGLPHSIWSSLQSQILVSLHCIERLHILAIDGNWWQGFTTQRLAFLSMSIRRVAHFAGFSDSPLRCSASFTFRTCSRRPSAEEAIRTRSSANAIHRTTRSLLTKYPMAGLSDAKASYITQLNRMADRLDVRLDRIELGSL